MPTRPFTQHYDPDDVFVSTLVGQVGHLGLLCLIVMERLYPAQIKAARLAFMFKVKDPRKTLDPVLSDLYTYGYASHTGAANWIITDAGRNVIGRAIHPIASTAASTVTLLPVTQPALPIGVDNSPNSVEKSAGENLRHDRSSSSDLIDQSLIDRSIQIEEEDAENFSGESELDRRAAVAAWCGQKSVTGEKRDRILADAWCTVARLDAWLTEMERRGSSGSIKFRNRFGALNYAITCCLNHDDPPTPYVALSAPLAADPAAGPENISVADPVADAHRRYPPIESRVWTSIRDELASDLKNVAARRICQALYPTTFDDDRLQLVVVDPTGLSIARQFQISFERMLKRDTQRAYTVEFLTL